MSVLQQVGLAAGAVTAVLGLLLMLRQMFIHAVRDAVGDDLVYIRAELSANHGKSVKDVVNRVDRWSAVADVRLETLEKKVLGE